MDAAFQLALVSALLLFLAIALALLVRNLRWDPDGAQQWNAAKKTATFHAMAEVVAFIAIDKLGAPLGLLGALGLLSKCLCFRPSRGAILGYGICAAVAALLGARTLVCALTWGSRSEAEKRALVEGQGALLLPSGYSEETPWDQVESAMSASRLLCTLLLGARCYAVYEASASWVGYPRSSSARPPFSPRAMASQDCGSFAWLVCDGSWCWEKILQPIVRSGVAAYLPLVLITIFWGSVGSCMALCYTNGGWSANNGGGRQTDEGGGVRGSLPNLSQLGDLEPERFVWRGCVWANALTVAPAIALLRHRQLGELIDARPELGKDARYQLRNLRNCATAALFYSYAAISAEAIFVLSAYGAPSQLLHYWAGYAHGAAAILHHAIQALVVHRLFAAAALSASPRGVGMGGAHSGEGELAWMGGLHNSEIWWYGCCIGGSVGFLMLWVVHQGGTLQWAAALFETSYFVPYSWSWWREHVRQRQAGLHANSPLFRDVSTPNLAAMVGGRESDDRATRKDSGGQQQQLLGDYRAA
eukprot:SAG11_NODE_2652_length_3124_cov_2.558347_1_plen_531_part_00